MNDKELSFDDKKEIEKIIKEFVAEDGSSNIVDVVNIYGAGKEIPIYESNYSDLEGMITQDKRYIVKSKGADYLIAYRNPNYKNDLLHEVKVQVIAGIVALVVGTFLWLIQRQYTNQEVTFNSHEVHFLYERSGFIYREILNEFHVFVKAKFTILFYFFFVLATLQLSQNLLKKSPLACNSNII